ncbi:twin-arginine translocase subunit TatC [Sphingomonas sp. GlSt437]|uniref:twin-arginine translocase subunit TatC n=1 Tax=Sphingomonas sp. GlSt437 TaxID=3389970 RepID=UPI003A8BC423
MRDIDDSRAPLLDHLIELRTRLIRSLLALLVSCILCYVFAEDILAILVRPGLHAGLHKLIYTRPFDAFFVNLKVAFFAGLMCAFPVIANQLWQFVAPGLYRKEKKALLPFLFATPVLFCTGAAMAYFVAVPAALHFLLSFQGDVGGVQREALPAVDAYLDFMMQFLFGFGIAFLMPILLMLLERAGIVTRKQLVGARRYAVVGNFGIALILAPPDAGSMLLLALPLCVLYELALIGIWFTERRRGNADATLETT